MTGSRHTGELELECDGKDKAVTTVRLAFPLGRKGKVEIRQDLRGVGEGSESLPELPYL